MSLEQYLTSLIGKEIISPLANTGYVFGDLEQVQRDVLAVYLFSPVNDTLGLNLETLEYINVFILSALQQYLSTPDNYSKAKILPCIDYAHYCYMFSVDKFSFLQQLNSLGINLLVGDKLVGFKSTISPHDIIEQIVKILPKVRKNAKAK